MNSTTTRTRTLLYCRHNETFWVRYPDTAAGRRAAEKQLWHWAKNEELLFSWFDFARCVLKVQKLSE